MREWVPVRTSARGRLVVAGLALFGRTSFDDVAVGALAAAAEVTTGAIYHHFGSKAGLYAVVRDDVDARVRDRIEGATEAAEDADRSLTGALTASFDFAVREDFVALLSTPPHDPLDDEVASAFATAARNDDVAGRVIAGTWRAALSAVQHGDDADAVRAVLARLRIDPAISSAAAQASKR